MGGQWASSSPRGTKPLSPTHFSTPQVPAITQSSSSRKPTWTLFHPPQGTPSDLQLGDLPILRPDLALAELSPEALGAVWWVHLAILLLFW